MSTSVLCSSTSRVEANWPCRSEYCEWAELSSAPLDLIIIISHLLHNSLMRHIVSSSICAFFFSPCCLPTSYHVSFSHFISFFSLVCLSCFCTCFCFCLSICPVAHSLLYSYWIVAQHPPCKVFAVRSHPAWPLLLFLPSETSPLNWCRGHKCMAIYHRDKLCFSLIIGNQPFDILSLFQRNVRSILSCSWVWNVSCIMLSFPHTCANTTVALAW